MSGNADSAFRVSDLPLRAKLTYAAHAFKAVTKQHHKWFRFLLRKFIVSDAVVLDIGGHSGQYAKLFAGLAPKGIIYSFEPGGYPRSILRLMTRFSRMNNVVPVGMGLGSEPGSLTLTTPLKSTGIYRFGLAHMGDDAGDVPTAQETVAVTTVDLFVEENNLDRLDFVKIDVEGWEAQILKGGARTIQKHRPTLLVELVQSQLERAGDQLETTWSDLKSWGYLPYVYVDHSNMEPRPAPRDGDTFWIHESRFPIEGLPPYSED